MNRDHQRICPRCGTSPLADDVRCWNCDYPLPKVGDSTPPATAVEPPECTRDQLRVAAPMTRIEQIRQREQVTGWGTFGELHADVTALLSAWDTRDAALRTLVEQWRAACDKNKRRAFELAAQQAPLAAALISDMYATAACADALDAILKETT